MTTNVYQIPETVPIWSEVRNWAGTLVTPSQGSKVTLKDPDGVLAKAGATDIEDVAMSESATGIYVYYYQSAAPSTLATELSATATTLSVASGEGTNYPASNFYIRIGEEILKCTSRATDVLTVVRGQRSTKATAHSSGASVHRIKGWWNYSCKAVDGSSPNERTTITHGSFELK